MKKKNGVIANSMETQCEVDISIIKGCKNNKIKSQENLYKQFYAYGMSIALRYSYSRAEAAEILNDSYLKVFDNINEFNENQSFKAWFRVIIIHTAIDQYRKNTKYYHQTDLIEAKFETDDYNILSELNVEDLLNILNRLPEIYRLTFNLYEIEGFSHDEIAEKMNIATSTSRSNLTRAKKMLREVFHKQFKEKYARAI